MICLDRSVSNSQTCALPNPCIVENNPSGIFYLASSSKTVLCTNATICTHLVKCFDKCFVFVVWKEKLMLQNGFVLLISDWSP